MYLTLYKSKVKENAKNCVYAEKKKISNKDELKDVISFDHVCAEFKNSYRSKDNFLLSNCDVFDCDNEHSENEEDWIYPEDYEFIFGDVNYVVVASRNDGKIKNGKKARPRHHVYFPHKEFTSAKECEDFKRQVYENYTFFDSAALDAARFIYGCDTTDIIWNEGSQNIEDVLYDSFLEFEKSVGKIKSGSRNKTMSLMAGKIIIRYGVTEKAREIFDEYATKCEPPLDDIELNKIWFSASKFGNKIASQEGYIPPEKFNQEFSLMPDDFSDVGQAIVLSKAYKNRIKYSPATDYLVYNGSIWEESIPKAQKVAQDLTEAQLEESQLELKKCMRELNDNGAYDLIKDLGVNKAKLQFNEEQKRCFEKYEKAIAYEKYAIKRRDSRYIWSALKEARPLIEVKQNQLDLDEFLLNTPSNTYNLKTGEILEHNYEDFITKQTNVDPSNEGMKLWKEALDTFFINDKDLIDYVQKIVGLSAVGKVYVEALIIAYGDGRNGKSTFWNVISRVLGLYSGTMSADILTVGCRRNVKPELAEAKGKRLLIAAELEEGMRMNTSNVKQLCSTDEISAEKKFKSPFSYIPSHTLVLYTNHLPRVGAIDRGTWRRLIVIPFNAKIEGNSDIKNYGDYLYHNAGGAVLSWIIEGAKKVIEEDFKIKPPAVVKRAIEKYQEDNDWFSSFLYECCEVGDSYREKSGKLYSEYRAYALSRGEFTRSTTDFYTALQSENFERKRTKKGVIVYGLKLKTEFDE